jgi:hypothetical protein
LPSGVVGPRDLAPLRRLVSARALLIVTAARDATSALHMAGFPAGWGGGWEGGDGGPKRMVRGSGILADHRNLVQKLAQEFASRRGALKTSGLWIAKHVAERADATAVGRRLRWSMRTTACC